MPIYIDKPLALKKRDAIRILERAKYDGQVFSCSALKYSNTIKVGKNELDAIGKIKKIKGF